jgi:hypothetical protein
MKYIAKTMLGTNLWPTTVHCTWPNYYFTSDRQGEIQDLKLCGRHAIFPEEEKSTYPQESSNSFI